jgi:acetate kinase
MRVCIGRGTLATGEIMTRRAIATFNVGSSSLKFSMFELTPSGELGDCLLRGAVRDLSGARRVDVSAPAKLRPLEAVVASVTDPKRLIAALAAWLAGQDAGIQLSGIGHRIVHGGTLFEGPVPVSDNAIAHLQDLAIFAPAHQPHNLAGVQAVEHALPEVQQTLSFDTAFHRTMPRIAELYALPRALSEQGILRFGFHGLSYAHISETLGSVLGQRPKRVLALHLGSGASACAIVQGQSIATSMGLTALDGLPMATRCGDLDPGVVLHLIKDRGMPVDDVSEMLYKQSGLLGVSGISGDTKALLDSAAPEAKEAIDLYCYRIAAQSGSLAVAMGGIDAIAFSGGVGENAPEIRSRIIQHLNWLGPALDRTANESNSDVLSPNNAPVPVVRIVADEERIIARECASLL